MREWLKALRGGKTCKEFGAELGLSEVTYNRIEHGNRQKKMDYRLLLKIALVSGKPLAEVMEAENQWRNES